MFSGSFGGGRSGTIFADSDPDLRGGGRANKIRIREVIKPGVTWRLVASRLDTSSLSCSVECLPAPPDPCEV